MEIITTNQLNKSDLRKIKKLISSCEKVDNASYNFYLGEESHEGDSFTLIKHHGKILGFTTTFAADIPEVSGLIAPKFRRNGYFSMLMDRIPYENYIIYGHDNWPGLHETANYLGFTNMYHECLMQYSAIPSKCDTNISYQFKDGTYTFLLNDQIIGHISIEKTGGLINIYNVFINEEFRGKGYGKATLELVLKDIFSNDVTIVLQVSEKNKPAYNLYLACGFTILSSVVNYSRFV